MPSTKLVNPGTDEEDESPETVSLSQSRATAKGKEIALNNAATREKQKRKESNRLRDLKLKQRAEETRGSTSKTIQLRSGSADSSDGEKQAKKGKERSGNRATEMSVEDRMERAMREAMEEDGTDADSGADSGGDDEDMEFGQDNSEQSGFSDDEEEGGALGSSTGDSEGEDNEDEGTRDLKGSHSRNIPQWKKAAQEEYLPDHIFAAAAATAPSRQTKSSDKTPAGKLKPSEKQKKKRRRRQGGKDLIIGAKTIRTLPQPRIAAPILAAASTVPPRRVTKFVKRSLGLTKGDAKRKGWERRPVNIGSMRSSAGPPAHFVRTA
ncbi:hypothetical protein BD410DRAFT_829631 [Rickenella mellea]|uniref:Uncharacterized protein n=1 Tax=Rickenella mellea TaxID=50990 RepID=A0A4Y7PYV2_9AGAM|nr:hypothetical protein BD410DRAFT_829631 [Rickenella mellea]